MHRTTGLSSGVAQAIGARRALQFCLPKVVQCLIPRYVYIGTLKVTKFSHSINAVDNAPFSLKAKINKSLFNTCDNNIRNSNLLKFHTHFCHPS